MTQPVAPGDHVGPFILEHALSAGRGGMSEVYMAHLADRPDHRAAVKVQNVRKETRAAYQDLLRQEAALLRQLRHPRVVRIYPLQLGAEEVRYAGRVTSDTGIPAWYYAMEYIDGESLDAFIRRSLARHPRHYGLAWRVELFYQIATGVYYLHQMGVAHCDIKPDNVLFRLQPDPYRPPSPILIDFGSATRGAQPRHLTASIGYSPPEVILALERSDISLKQIKILPRRIDVWSLGALLYEILMGEPLIDRQRANIATTLIRERLQVNTLVDRYPEAGASLDRLLAVMLRRDPAQRPSLNNVIVALEERIAAVRPPRIAAPQNRAAESSP